MQTQQTTQPAATNAPLLIHGGSPDTAASMARLESPATFTSTVVTIAETSYVEAVMQATLAIAFWCCAKRTRQWSFLTLRCTFTLWFLAGAGTMIFNSIAMSRSKGGMVSEADTFAVYDTLSLIQYGIATATIVGALGLIRAARGLKLVSNGDSPTPPSPASPAAPVS